MTMEENYTKVFTGTLIIIRGLEHLLNEHNIVPLIKNHNESARLSGFGVPSNSVELFLLTSELEKAKPIIESYKEKINI